MLVRRKFVFSLFALVAVLLLAAWIILPSLARARSSAGQPQMLAAFSGSQDSWRYHNTETYRHISDNAFKNTTAHPLSTFSVDVDTASYSNMRRFLELGELPPKDAVRIEELVNYFPYDYPEPPGNDPIAISVETTQAFWNKQHELARIGIKAKDLDWAQRPKSNLVFLLDVSGSMQDTNKLPLVKQSMQMIVEKLGQEDRVAIVVYAGSSGLVLPSTNGEDKRRIQRAISRLNAGGSTNGGEGIQLAYKVALENFIEGGVNRVILATDGDFNVGVTNEGDLTRLIQEASESGVFLTVLGYGMGNYKDATLETLADKGNGNYAYIDSEAEARKVLVQQLSGTVIAIAKDVKIQVEFNPQEISSYRLIGYENRLLEAEDFNDDKKDAGDIGVGHTVTALYELVPVGLPSKTGNIDPLKYLSAGELTDQAHAGELMTVKVRYKDPESAESQLVTLVVPAQHRSFEEASPELRFAASVASFGMLLRESEYKGQTSYETILDVATDPVIARDEYRKEFVDLVKIASDLAG